jgi:hypothetical protein
MFDVDPRTRDHDAPEVDVHWVTLWRGPSEDDARDREPDVRDRAVDPRDRDPRDPFVEGLQLPRASNARWCSTASIDTN